jgi:hypothetical protein
VIVPIPDYHLKASIISFFLQRVGTVGLLTVPTLETIYQIILTMVIVRKGYTLLPTVPTRCKKKEIIEAFRW